MKAQQEEALKAQQELEEEKKKIDEQVARQMRLKKEEDSLRRQMSQGTIYMSTMQPSGTLEEWDNPQAIEVNTQVIALTSIFTCIIYYFGFCCGSFFIYKLRYRLPVQNQNQEGFELEDYSMEQRDPIDCEATAFATPMNDKDKKMGKKGRDKNNKDFDFYGK